MQTTLPLSDNFRNNPDDLLSKLGQFTFLEFQNIFFDHHLKFLKEYNLILSLTLITFNSSFTLLSIQAPVLYDIKYS